MVEVVLALAAIAVTAAIVLGDAHPPRRESPPPEQPTLEEARPVPSPVTIDVDAPTEMIDVAALTAEALPVEQTTFALPLPSAEILPSRLESAMGTPHAKPDPERLIQTEVIIPDGSAERRMAVTRLAIGITASGLVLGLVTMGLARAIGAFVKAL